MARSVYTDTDVYILDDPLSAVDAHVGKHLFEKVIGPTGMLNKKVVNRIIFFCLALNNILVNNLNLKTRVFATNSLNFLSDCDRIIMLQDGEIKEIGSYKSLLKNNGVFAEFFGTYLQTSETSKQNSSFLIKKSLLSNTI